MWETRIYYGDTDAGGVIYYANYLRYFEKSWFEYLAARGLSLVEWEKEGIFFIIKRVEVDYISPARYGEIIEVQTDVSEVTRASFTFYHRVILKDTSRLIAEGKNQMVWISAEGKLRRFPPEFLQRLQGGGE
ncbi:MAG: acyl-CoA thioesterase [Deltaproteobacteria bacterium]|nr:acyl-CoA thioesterase [Deltaproteobacteria bacterium]